MRALSLALGFSCLLSLAGCEGKAGSEGSTGPAGSTGPSGPAGMDGTDGTNATTGTPSVSLVWPRAAVPGKVLQVAIAGSGTDWSSAVVVSFGAGITVNQVSRQSESALLASLTISDTAMPGPRDVTVTEGTTQTLSGGFEVVPFAELEVLGAPKQSSIIRVRVKVNDPDFAFDFNGQDAFPSLSGGSTLASDASPREVTAVIGLAGYAPLGPATITLIDRPRSSGRRVLRFPDAVTIIANNATVVTKGTPIDVTFAGPWDSALFALPTTVTGTLGVAAIGQAPGVKPKFVAMVATDFSGGLVADSLWDNAVLAGCTSCPLKYFVMSANGTPGAARFQVTDVAQENEPNDATPNPLSGIPLAVVAWLNDTDRDGFSFVATAADVGKTLTIATEGVALNYVLREGSTVRGNWYGGQLSTSTSWPVTAAGTYSVGSIQLMPAAAAGQYTLTARFE